MDRASDEHAVIAAERALQAAMRASDVEELDRLLHPDLLAVGPDGALIDKAADLAAHRSRVFVISALEEEDLLTTVWVVNVQSTRCRGLELHVLCE